MSDFILEYTKSLKGQRLELNHSVKVKKLNLNGQLVDSLVDLGLEFQSQLITFGVLLGVAVGKENSFRFMTDFCKDLLVELNDANQRDVCSVGGVGNAKGNRVH